MRKKCPKCGSAQMFSQTCSTCGTSLGGPALSQPQASVAKGQAEGAKSKLAAGLLGVFFGGVGVHRFYLGYVGIGIAQIIVTLVTAGIGAIWGFIEGILILVGVMNKDAKGQPLNDSTGMPRYGWVLVAFGCLLIVGLLGSLGNDQGAGGSGKAAADFVYAMPGEHWVIEDDDISVLKKPEATQDRAQFIRNLVTVIGQGTVVEILETEGMFSPSKRVHVYKYGNEIYATGWILAETVKGARKIPEPL